MGGKRAREGTRGDSISLTRPIGRPADARSAGRTVPINGFSGTGIR